MTVHTGPSERSSPSELHAQTARPPDSKAPVIHVSLALLPLFSGGCDWSTRLPSVGVRSIDLHGVVLSDGGARSHVLCIDDGQSTARLHPHAHIAHLSPIGH